jgi:hypothetical protein
LWKDNRESLAEGFAEAPLTGLYDNLPAKTGGWFEQFG